MRIKKGDTVKIMAGKDKGKTGAVLHVHPKTGRLSVEGVNVYSKRSRPKSANQKGETVNVVRPFAESNAMLVCPNCKQATRVGIVAENDHKLRTCRKCGKTIT